jgi:hypothetical protein
MGELRTIGRRFALLARASVLIAASVAVLGVGHLPSTARADGDPASDILLLADFSLPYSEPVSDLEKARLDEVVRKAKRAHYPIKVAVISSSLDLGSDDRFTGHPGLYARFLSSELASPKSFRHRPKSHVADVRVPILVVMRDGIALARRGKLLPTGDLGNLDVPSRPGADPIAERAVIAIQRLAARAGQRLAGIGPPPPATSDTGQAAPSSSGPTSSDDGSLSGWAIAGIVAAAVLALAVGGAVIARVARRRRAQSP